VRPCAAKAVLLIIGGGIAAYKSLELIRRLRERGGGVRAILTKAGSEFITPLSVSSLAGERVFQDCSASPTKPRWAISSFRARPIWLSWRPQLPI
jgi:phosphopantothenoylcysteine synthetase/decarboxylase